MEKLVYLSFKTDEDSIETFRAKLVEEVCPRLLELGARWLSLNVADLAVQIAGSPLVMGEGKNLSASISFWLRSLDQRTPLENALRQISSKLWGYLVTESVPLEYADRNWSDGTKSPGVTLVTAFAKPARLSDEQFFGYWHGSHTPLSFELHPLWRYVRNSVARPLTADAPAYRAIVEERFRELDDVLDLNRFFRGAAENMRRAMEDVDRFLDREDVNCTLMSEYIIKS
jgi:hypothetical protein